MPSIEGGGNPVATPIFIAAGSSFDPISLITGSGAFFRADVGVTQSSGNVSAWADQSSFAQNLTVVSSTAPTWSSSAFNTSFDGISFSNSNATFIKSATGFVLNGTTAGLSTSVGSVFMLLTQSHLSGVNNQRFMGLANGGSDTADFGDITCFYDDTVSDAVGAFAAGIGFVGSTGGLSGQWTPITTGVPLLFGMVYDGTNWTMWLNGVSQTSGQTAGTLGLGGNSAQYLNVGADGGGGSNDTFVAAFAGITQKVMNSTDWTNLKNWCNSNWGTSF